MSTIQLRKGNGDPTIILDQGEPAFDFTNNSLWIGTPGGNRKVIAPDMYLTYSRTTAVDEDLNAQPIKALSKTIEVSSTPVNFPNNYTSAFLIQGYSANTDWMHQLLFGADGVDVAPLWTRSMNNGTWGRWCKVIADNGGTLFGDLIITDQKALILGDGTNTVPIFYDIAWSGVRVFGKLQADGEIFTPGHLTVGGLAWFTGNAGVKGDLTVEGLLNVGPTGPYHLEVTAKGNIMLYVVEPTDIASDANNGHWLLGRRAMFELITSNLYSDGTDIRYLFPANFGLMFQSDPLTGGFNWYSAPLSAAGGEIATLTKSMNLDNAGNLTVTGSVIASYVNSSGNIDATGGFNTPVGIWAGTDISAGGNVSAAGNVSGNYISSAGEIYATTNLACSTGIKFAARGTNLFEMVWAPGGILGDIGLYVDNSYQGLLVRSYSGGDANITQLQSIQLLGASSTMQAIFNGGQVSWPITFSDRKLKNNITPCQVDALEIINRMSIYSLDLTPPFPGAGAEHWDCSIIADEIKGLIPNAYRPATSDDSYETVVELPLIATLIRAFQQLSDKVISLENRMH